MERRVFIRTTTGEEVELKLEKESLPKRAWNATKTAAIGVKNFVIEHPIAALTIVTAGVRLANNGINNWCKVKKVNAYVDKLKKNELDHYDFKNHMWYTLKRPLTGREKIELAQRRENGETDISILSDFGVV